MEVLSTETRRRRLITYQDEERGLNDAGPIIFSHLSLEVAGSFRLVDGFDHVTQLWKGGIGNEVERVMRMG